MIQLLLYFLIQPLFIQTYDIPLWNKHYLTYSIENDLHNTEMINKAIKDWNLRSLELQQVNKSQGDIKIRFVDYLASVDNNNTITLGKAESPEGGNITIVRGYSEDKTLRVIQHELGHAFGLLHSNDDRSIMYEDPIKYPISESDKRLLYDLYKCRYDSVTLLNDKTYFKFKGRYYVRMDFNTGNISRDKLWHPSITKVTSMYRNNSDYYIISDNRYFKFNDFMQFEKEGSIQEIFPNISRNVLAVLTFQTGTIFYFLEDNYLWYNNTEIENDLENFPEDDIQGAFSKGNYIYFVSRDNLYKYDYNFTFIEKTRLCDNLHEIHCCNEYSNLPIKYKKKYIDYSNATNTRLIKDFPIKLNRKHIDYPDTTNKILIKDVPIKY